MIENARPVQIEENMNNLDETISDYAKALEHTHSDKPECPKSKVMDVFIARDRVAHVLANTQLATSYSLGRITELDQELRKDATRINSMANGPTLANWRESLRPAESAWWWWLDVHPAAESKFISLRALAAWVCWLLIAISLSFILEVVRRFLSTGVDVPSIVLQGLLALLVGSTIIQLVGQVAGGSTQVIGKQGKGNRKAQIVLAGLLVLVAVGTELFRAQVVAHYSNQGVLNTREGKLSTAIENYQRAISLKPNDSLAHYNLASAYEGTLEYDKAEAEFHAAIRCDGQYCLAYNRLARLYMLRRSDYVSALMLLKTGLEKLDLMKANSLINESGYRDFRFALLRNRGWAYYGLGYYRQAADDLRLALEIRPRGAVAHCLFAQLLEAEKNPQRDSGKAMEEYTKCVGYSQLYDDNEESWLSLARERLSQEDPEPKANEGGEK